jgi:DNA (cytosine-5)-methyltransferase 1
MDTLFVDRAEQSELIVDSFAGGGGTSTGLEAAGLKVHIAINHNRRAIAMHRVNHPNTQHFCEDVWKVDPKAVCGDRPVGLFWLSPDCTFHSRARGGRPFRDRRKTHRTRGLAWLAVHWAKTVAPRVIMLENVCEFVDWGPLADDGSPCPMRKGFTFRRFVRMLQNLGYVVDWQPLRACDLGVPTSRQRLFLVARRDQRPIIWPEPTHGCGSLPYRSAGECIDWSIPCPSIFDPERQLVPATLRRIARGLRRHMIETPTPYVVEIGEEGQGPERRQLIGATLIQVSYGERKGQAPRVPGLDKPLGTVVAGGAKHALVVAFLAKHYGGHENHGTSLFAPIDTITTKDHNALVTARLAHRQCPERVRAFLIEYYSTEQRGRLREPLPTVTTHDRFAMVVVRGEEYVIEDIGMRLLTPRELFRAQGFPDSYIIDRGVLDDGVGGTYPIQLTKTQQVHLCGNSVPPPLAQALAYANLMAPPETLSRFQSGRLF